MNKLSFYNRPCNFVGRVSMSVELIQMMNFKKKLNSDKYAFSLNHRKLEIQGWEHLGAFFEK